MLQPFSGFACEADGLRYYFFPDSGGGLRIIHGNESLNAIQFGFRAPGKSCATAFKVCRDISAGLALVHSFTQLAKICAD
jgi:hypothetical protein